MGLGASSFSQKRAAELSPRARKGSTQWQEIMTPRQVAEAYLAAWNAHDADAAAALMADDVTYFDVIVGKPQKGRDAARDKVIKLFVTAAPDLTFKMTGEPIESANGIAYEFTFAGTNTGAWGCRRLARRFASATPTVR